MKIVIIVISLLFIACNNKQNASDTKEVQYGDWQDGISILTVDSCEYVWVKRGYGGGLSHKGNCKYCTPTTKNN